MVFTLTILDKWRDLCFGPKTILKNAILSFFKKMFFLIGLGPISLNLGSTFQDGLGVKLQICQDGFWSENDRKHPTKLFYYAFLLLALFPSSSLSSSSLEALASDDHWLPLNQGMEFKVESFASKSSGVWRSKIWSFFEGQMQTPLKIGYYRPLWEGFIHLYDYNAFFKMVWGPKHKFLHFFGMVWG